MAAYRKRLNRKSSKKMFKRQIMKRHKLNKPRLLKRGGTRL